MVKLIFDKYTKAVQSRKDSLFNKFKASNCKFTKYVLNTYSLLNVKQVSIKLLNNLNKMDYFLEKINLKKI